MVDLPFRMTLSDLEWFSEMFNDTKQRSVSLRQLSFLYYVRWTVNQVRNFGVCLSYYGFDTLPDLNYELTTALTVLLRICDGVRRKTLILGWFLCLYQTRLACGGIIFSTCPFLRSSICVFVRHQTCEHDFFLKSEPVLMQIGTSGPWARTGNGQLWGSGAQRSMSHKAKIFGGIILNPFGSSSFCSHS